MPENGLLHLGRQAAGGKDPDSLRGMLGGRRPLLVGKSLVVEVVQQADDSPRLLVRALLPGHRAHGDLDGVHVSPEGLGSGVLVNEGEGGLATEHGFLDGEW